jgi:outer membrane protein assembly factor BamB
MLGLGFSIGCGSSETDPAEEESRIGEDTLWSVQVSTKGAPVTRPVVGPDGMIYVGGAVRNASGVQACLYEINPDGTIARELLGSPKASKMWVTVSSQGTVYALDREGGLYMFPSIGDGIFQPNAAKEVGLDSQLASLIAVPDGTVYARGRQGLFALTVDYSNTLGVSQTRSFERGSRYTGPSVMMELFEEISAGLSWDIDHGTPFFGDWAVGYDGARIRCRGSKLIALSRQMETLWTYRIQDLRRSPRVGHHWTIYALGPTDLQALTANGEPKWTYHNEHRLMDTPILGKNTIYLSDAMGHVLGVSRTGELVWSTKVGMNPSPPALGTGGILYVRCMQGFLHAIKPTI